MIDALCHLELYASPADAARALDAAAVVGVTDVVSAGTDPLAPEPAPPSGAARVHRAFGIHPENVQTGPMLDRQLQALERRLGGPDVVALGECGIDARDHAPPMDAQERALSAQLAIARARDLPVIVHGVRAPAKILEAMTGAGVRWVWHGFGESLETARQVLATGGLISVGALILNPRARKLREAIAGLDTDVLIETDAPDVDLRTLGDVVGAIAILRGKRPADVALASVRAACALYRLPLPATATEGR